MTDDFHPEPFDDELRRRFGGGGGDGDTDTVLDTMRPRLQRARTRRRVALTGACAAAAAVVVVVVFALGGGGGGDGSVHTPPASRGPDHVVPSTPTTSTPAGGATTPTSVPETADDHGTDAGASTPPSTDAPSPTTPGPAAATSPAAPADQTYSSDGGSITVHLANGAASLVSDTPAAGYGAEVHDNGPARVEVRFSNGATEWRIRVDVTDGRLVPEITQH